MEIGLGRLKARPLNTPMQYIASSWPNWTRKEVVRI